MKGKQYYDNMMASLKEKNHRNIGFSEYNFKHQTIKLGMISRKDHRRMGTSNRQGTEVTGYWNDIE